MANTQIATDILFHYLQGINKYIYLNKMYDPF